LGLGLRSRMEQARQVHHWLVVWLATTFLFLFKFSSLFCCSHFSFSV
jgi:hypothetical protein